MRKFLKFLHTLASCGLIGGLTCYALLLVFAPQSTPATYADLRQSINAISDYVLLASLAVALVLGLLSMAVHTPFQKMRWAWLKALLGISMFEATLGIIGSKANYAAKVSAEIAAGTAKPDMLASALSTEWSSLFAIMALSIANVVLVIWRPRLYRAPTSSRARSQQGGFI